MSIQTDIGYVILFVLVVVAFLLGRWLGNQAPALKVTTLWEEGELVRRALSDEVMRLRGEVAELRSEVRGIRDRQELKE